MTGNERSATRVKSDSFHRSEVPHRYRTTTSTRLDIVRRAFVPSPTLPIFVSCLKGRTC